MTVLPLVNSSTRLVVVRGSLRIMGIFLKQIIRFVISLDFLTLKETVEKERQFSGHPSACSNGKEWKCVGGPPKSVRGKSEDDRRSDAVPASDTTTCSKGMCLWGTGLLRMRWSKFPDKTGWWNRIPETP